MKQRFDFSGTLYFLVVLLLNLEAIRNYTILNEKNHVMTLIILDCTSVALSIIDLRALLYTSVYA